MAHKTKINGTNYDVSGGKTLIGGTAYKITGGRTLIGGTAYDINFLPAVGTALSACTPEEIQAIAQSGLAASYWSVGDTVGITLNGTVGALTFSNETYYAFIIGFNHNSSIEGSNTIHFQFGKASDGTDIAFVDSITGEILDGAGFCMNFDSEGSTNVGGWASSYMRNTICPAFLSAMPSSWRNVIATCTKYSDNVGDGSTGNSTSDTPTSTSDKIWLLAECEVFGDTYGYDGDGYANFKEKNYQKQYTYYANGNSEVKYEHSDASSTTGWWLRSVRALASGRFCNVTARGQALYRPSNYSEGFAPGFMVG